MNNTLSQSHKRHLHQFTPTTEVSIKVFLECHGLLDVLWRITLWARKRVYRLRDGIWRFGAVHVR